MPRIPLPRCLALTLALAASGLAHAQSPSPDWSSFLSITPVHQGKADLDNGGDMASTSLLLRAGVSTGLRGGHRAGVTLNYDYTDYSFGSPAAFGGRAPWGSIERYGFSLPLSYALQDGWSLGVAPSVDWFGERGADRGDSLAWGGLFTATRRYADGNRLGFGFGAFDRFEKTSVFPLLLVDWKLSQRWKLVNPLPAGPTGPAGLELDYRFDSDWNLGLGAAWRSTRFRLGTQNVVANGIGEERGVPVFLRASRNFGKQAALNLYAGVVTNGQLRVEDAAGNTLRRVDLDTAPVVGATFTLRY
jgi:hypothetical protein